MLEPKLAAARTVGALARRTGRGGGTSLPGKLLLRLEPHAIGRLAGRLADGNAVISATNGKTTTAAMVAAVLARAGTPIVHNRTGSNMAGGIASTLLGAARPGARIAGELGLFEVDEFWLPRVAAELSPRALVLGNLFRDQLDRYGELEAIADRWAALVDDLAPRGTRLLLNADDPLVADLGRGTGDGLREGVAYFGVCDDAVALPGLQHASDSKHCRRCGAAYVYEAVYLSHLGRYHCPSCGRHRPEPEVAAERVTLHGVHAATVGLRTPAGAAELRLPLPGLYNVYNALAAVALCLALGVSLADVVAGLQGFQAAFGRAETLTIDGRELAILLVKNPAGANEVLRTLALEDSQLDLLGILNDRIADGRDVSWVWDADFEAIAGRVRHATCAGTRAAELAVRLKYAGVDPARLAVVPELGAALDRALGDGRAPLYVLPTYTAMLGLREVLADRGHTPRFWAS